MYTHTLIIYIILTNGLCKMYEVVNSLVALVHSALADSIVVSECSQIRRQR